MEWTTCSLVAQFLPWGQYKGGVAEGGGRGGEGGGRVSSLAFQEKRAGHEGGI